MNYSKEGPGPASRNIRDGNDPLASFKPKRISSIKTGFSLEKRETGLANANFKNPAPNAYQLDTEQVKSELQKSNLLFNQAQNSMDIARYG